MQRATVAAAAIAGELYVADYGEHEIAGVAAWFGPGRALLDRLVSYVPIMLCRYAPLTHRPVPIKAKPDSILSWPASRLNLRHGGRNM